MKNVKLIQKLNIYFKEKRNLLSELLFFNEIIDVATKASDAEDLENEMRLIFAKKIKFPEIPFDYGLTKDGMIITHKYTEGNIMIILYDTNLDG